MQLLGELQASPAIPLHPSCTISIQLWIGWSISDHIRPWFQEVHHSIMFVTSPVVYFEMGFLQRQT